MGLVTGVSGESRPIEGLGKGLLDSGVLFSCLVLGDPQGVGAGNQLKMLHFQLMVSVLGNKGWRLQLPDPDSLAETGPQHTRTFMCKQFRGPHKVPDVPLTGV